MFENTNPPKVPSADPSAIKSEAHFATTTAHQSDVCGVANVDQFTHAPVMDSGDLGDGAEAIPLRAIEWSELTARLSAARDLRQLLRGDVAAQSGSAALGFADAAAQFFRASEEICDEMSKGSDQQEIKDDERCVNPNALGPRKSSSGTYQNMNCGEPFEGHSAADESLEYSRSTRRFPSETREKQ